MIGRYPRSRRDVQRSQWDVARPAWAKLGASLKYRRQENVKPSVRRTSRSWRRALWSEM
jgi:hypothetical protein